MFCFLFYCFEHQEDERENTPPSSDSTPPSTRSQSRNVSFASPGLWESPRPVTHATHKAGERKVRPRKRGRRNSHILDSTSDKSDVSSDEETGDSGNLSPAYESPPPSPVITSTMSPYSRRSLGHTSASLTLETAPSTTTTTTTTTSFLPTNPPPPLSPELSTPPSTAAPPSPP